MGKRAVLVAALAVLALGVAAQTAAAPPEQVELDDFFPLFADVDDGLGLFVNVSRDDLCAWEASGFVGPPPVDQIVSVQLNETGKGAVVANFKGVLSVELWRFDQDVPPLIGLCPATDDQSGPWATGTAYVQANDNDFDGSRTRTNSYGVSGQGTVVDATGARWHLSWTSRCATKDDEFRCTDEQFNLHPVG
jgi:hypothetical protein